MHCWWRDCVLFWAARTAVPFRSRYFLVPHTAAAALPRPAPPRRRHRLRGSAPPAPRGYAQSKSAVAAYVRSRLEPYYRSGGLSKERFKQVARAVTEDFLSTCGRREEGGGGGLSDGDRAALNESVVAFVSLAAAV
jgi:hypothetical protein